MRTNVLFVTEKWCGSDPKLGFANYFDNLFNTFAEQRLECNMHTLHHDEAYQLYGVHIDTVLPKYCSDNDIQIIFFSFGGSSNKNPSIDSFKKLQEMGIFINFIWYDNNPSDFATREKIKEFIDLNIIIDYPRSVFHDSIERTSRDLYVWTPESEFSFYPASQDIDISFIGSYRYPERINYLRSIASYIPNLFIAGGQRESQLSFSAYSSLIRRSKIGINFCGNPSGNYQQVKGRVFEIIASKSLLMEEKNEGTSHFFTPGEDYIEFCNTEDLIYKIRFYSQNPEQRLKIVENGYNKYMSSYNSKIFWETVFSKIIELSS